MAWPRLCALEAVARARWRRGHACAGKLSHSESVLGLLGVRRIATQRAVSKRVGRSRPPSWVVACEVLAADGITLDPKVDGLR